MKEPHKDCKKIVEQALAFERPDRLPVYDGFWDEFIDNWHMKRSPPPHTHIEDYYWIDLKVCVAREELFSTRIHEVGKRGDFSLVDDGWGRIIKTKPGTYFAETVDRVLKSPSDLDQLEFDSPSLDSRYTDFVAEVATHREKGRPVFVKIGGPFIRTSFLRGEADFLMDMVTDEAFAAAMVQRVGEHLLAIGLESMRRINAFDTGVWIFDDMCNLAAPMFSPDTFARLFLPVYRKMISTLKAAGARRVFLHCDGNLLPFLDMLLEAGINGINPVEPAAGLDAVKLLEKYHGRLAFIGGVCNSRILPCGDEQKIRRHVEAIVDAGRNGGLVIGTHSIGPDISIENYEFYRRIVINRGAYKE